MLRVCNLQRTRSLAVYRVYLYDFHYREVCTNTNQDFCYRTEVLSGILPCHEVLQSTEVEAEVEREIIRYVDCLGERSLSLFITATATSVRETGILVNAAILGCGSFLLCSNKKRLDKLSDFFNEKTILSVFFLLENWELRSITKLLL